VRRARVARDAVFGAGGAIAGTVYGTIVVMAVIAGGSRGADTDAWRLAVMAATTALVLWLAHVYAHALAHSVAAKQGIRWVEIRELAWREAAVPLAAVAPVGALLLGALGAMPEQSAIRLALGLGVATLGVQGVRYARLERLGRTATLVAVSTNLCLGLTIVALEVAVAH
jgi:hypothetical protein